MRIAIAIPAFDAAPSVGDIAARAKPFASDLLVVDDGSRDATADAARAAGARVIRHARNLGKGRALRTAFDDLFGRGADAVVTVDADGQHLPEQIPVLLAAAGDADLVLGMRDHLFSQMSRVRRTSNRLSSRAISLIVGARIPDVQTGFRLYTRRLLAATGFPEPRFEAESAVLVRAVRRGFRVVGVPVALGYADGRCGSHYRALRDSVRIAAAIASARLGDGRPS